MANLLNEPVQVKLDGQFIPFKSVKMSNPPASSTPVIRRLDIELTLWDGRIINDDGSRVEIIIKS